MSIILATGNRRSPLAERGHDLYETPAVAVQALLRVERLPHVIWEPAAGRGAIVQVLREAGHIGVAQDLVDYGHPDIQSGIDFLTETAAPAGCEAIVTNPPYKNGLDGKFAAKAIELVPRVYLLCRLAFLESQRRSNVLDGGYFARVYAFKSRLPMMHRDGWEGPKAQSAMAFAWFVWDRNHRGGKPKIERIGTKRCSICDEQFIGREGAQTCSNRCRQKAYRRRVTDNVERVG